MPACHAGDRRFESGRVRHHRISLRPVRPPGRGVPSVRRSGIRRRQRWPDSGSSARPLSRSARCKGAPFPSPAVARRSGAPSPPSRARARRRSRRELGAVGRRRLRPRRRAPIAGAQPDRGADRIPAPTPTPPRPGRSPTCRSSPSPTSGRPPPRPRAGELEDVLAGTSTRYDALELVAAEADAILAALDVDRPADAARLVVAEDAAPSRPTWPANRKRLAFLRADAVAPAVRALAWGDKTLFGVDRVKTWPTGR